MKNLFSSTHIGDIVNVANVVLFVVIVVAATGILYFLKQIKGDEKYLMDEVYQDTKDPGSAARSAYDIKKKLVYSAALLMLATICIWEILKYIFIAKY